MKAATITPDYNFTVESTGGQSTITYKQTPWPYRMVWRMCWYNFVPACFLVHYIGPEDFTPAILFCLMLTLGLGCLTVFINNLFRMKQHRLTIDEHQISTATSTYEIAHISSMYIDNPNDREQPEIVVVTRSIRHNMGHIANRNRKAIQREMRNAAHKIIIRYGTRDIVLARNLGLIEADVLFKKIISLSGFGTPRPSTYAP